VAAAWCYFIWADSVGDACAKLTDDGLGRFLVDGDVPIVCGGGGLRPGALRAVPGGYRMTGTFRYGSGIHAASWVLLFGLTDDDGGRRDMRACIVAKDDLDLADDWHVLGMRGTGSVGFAAHDVFIPEELTYSASDRPRRGGRVYRTGIIGYLGFPLPAVTLAIARRALDELTATASTVTRGYARPRPLAERATFQHFLGEADVRLSAARALMLARGVELMEAVERPRHELRAVEAGVRAAGAHAARVASDVLADTVRFAGGAAARQGSVYERAVRDLMVAASHLIVDESAYENHAQFLLGLPGADPLA
jgi:alkylation response protein AidB-like acyl-CoA dehydrogenase